MRSAWKLWLVLGGLLTVLYYLVPNSPESKLLLYNGVGLLAVILRADIERFDWRDALPARLWAGESRIATRRCAAARGVRGR